MSDKSILRSSDGLDVARINAIVQVIENSVQSKHTKLAYSRALREFISWYQERGAAGLSKSVVQDYLSTRRAEGWGDATYNQARSAILRLVREAVDNGALSEQIARGIERIEGVSRKGVRLGNWLDVSRAERLINYPDVKTIKGLRDRAILALLIGTGIRRAELCSLDFKQLTQREGRWVILDLVGKGNKMRSPAVPAFAKACIDAWVTSAGISSGLVFRALDRGGHVTGEGISTQTVYRVVEQYSRAALGEVILPHDLRRTFSKLARKGGAPIEQISLQLGHSSIRTTEAYLGTEFDLVDAACDKLGLHINGF